ncbi:MAG TPA: ABC transporter permease [Coriobacteriia bacterium]|nr:ABC transporter permease [Coriobacteriia bacterium]
MRMLAIALKDVKVWTRDVAAMGVLLGMPIILIFILGSALGGGATNASIHVAVVNLDTGRTAAVPGAPSSSSQGDTTNLGNELVETLRESKRVNDAFDIEYEQVGLDTRRSEVADGQLAAVLVVPEDFTEKVQTGEPAELEVISDPGAELTAGIWQGVVSSFAAEYSAASVSVQTVMEGARLYEPDRLLDADRAAFLQQAAISSSAHDAKAAVAVVDSEADVAMEMTALDYYAVSMSAMFLMFGAMFGAFSTIKERREQTLSRLLSTPNGASTIIAGKMLGIFVLGMLQFTVLFLATRFMFGVEWGASILAIFLVAAAEVAAVTGLAVLIAAVAKTERGAGGLGPLVIQIQALIGGAFFAITVLPLWLQPVRYASVVGWALEGWQTVQVRGGGVADVLGPVAALLGFAAVFFVLGSALTGARR